MTIPHVQCVPSISNTHGYPTTLFPLFIVVLVDGVFQAIEDLSRHRADALANASVAHRCRFELEIHSLSVSLPVTSVAHTHSDPCPRRPWPRRFPR